MSAVAVVDGETGRPVALPLGEGEVTLPSVVLFESAGSKIVGRAARDKAVTDADLVLETVKNYMGTPTTWDFHGETYTPEIVSAVLLRRLREDAEKALGEPIEGAVITVPAIFGEAERHATRAAAEIAGLPLIALLEEPVAAAIAYGFSTATADTSGGNNPISDATVLLYDLGGGTFDLTVMQLTDNGATFKMIATDGDRRLGGRDWDKAIVDAASDAFMVKFGSDAGDPREDPACLNELMAKAEAMKQTLSRREKATLFFLYNGHEFCWDLTRSAFEALTADLLEQTTTTLRLMLRQLREKGKLLRGGADIDYVLLAGGSSRMPQVARMLRELSGKEPQMLDVEVIVAEGAAVYAAMKTVAGAVAPTAVMDTAPVEINPPTAAIQQAASTPAPRRLSLPDTLAERFARASLQRVCSFALGLIAVDDEGTPVNTVLVQRNTELPVMYRNVYGTASDNQREILVTVLEGDDEDPENCVLLGEGKIIGIPPGLAKGAPVEVTIGLTDESAIKVSAVDLTHNLRCEFELNRRVALSPDEIATSRLRLRRDTVTG